VVPYFQVSLLKYRETLNMSLLLDLTSRKYSTEKKEDDFSYRFQNLIELVIHCSSY
jgi:hypothetical protein